MIKRILAVMAAAVIMCSIMSIQPASALEDEGIIRVLLTKLQLTDQIRISTDGSYTLNGMAFQRGSHLTFSCAGGSIMLYYEGLSWDCGTEVTLQRHQTNDSQENGLRINDAYYLHPGDLRLSVLDGQLRAVLHAPIEEYLLGVVPYEMSDSFPLEALKVQAIAARTYALRKKQMSTLDYDVVDNTNDQAYFGIQWENKNAIEAVKATEGICGFYKGRLAECYYSASNGGQTELVQHVWGSGDYDYLTMVDDPYDLENENSVVKRFSIPKEPKTPQELGALLSPVLMAISEQMETMGYDGAEENIRIVKIDRVALSTPKYTDTASAIMEKLTLSLTVQGKKVELTSELTAGEEEDVSIFATPDSTVKPSESEWITLAEPVVAELQLHGEVVTLCDLDINVGSDNELITVVDSDSSYILESRRYGHGVGMSQRGAECMAGDYAWNADQILRFYYPGLKFNRVEYTAKIPTPLPYSFLSTPGPAATPTPRPTLMPVEQELKENEYKVIVNQISENSSLNLRAEPNTSSSVLRQLYYGQILVVTAVEGEWLQVKTDAISGYVMSKFVENIE